jgi:phage-related protein
VVDLSTKGFVGTYWFVLVQLRWVITITILVFSRDYNFIQLITLLLISGIFQVLTMLGKPLDSSLENAMTLFNEVMVSAYIYVLFILTDFFA